MSDLYHHQDEDPTPTERVAYQQGYDQAMKIAIEVGRGLAALKAENDALRKAVAMGLEYAESALERLKMENKGWPSRWELDERYVAEIKAALRGEGEQ
jgi:hypothetical protein